MCASLPSRALLPVLTKGDAGLAGRVPSFRSRQIRDDRCPRNAVSTEPIRLQAVPTASEPCATQIWYGSIFQASILLIIHTHRHKRVCTCTSAGEGLPSCCSARNHVRSLCARVRCCKATFRIIRLTRRGPRWLDPAQL